MNSDEGLTKKIADATNAGYRVEIHAIVLTALSTARVGPERRPILTHCQILGEDLISRMREQGVIGNIQPSFTVTDAAYVRKRLEDDVIPYSYCWKRMLDNGVACAGGSDAPIETCNPFQGIYDAIYRHKPNRPQDVFLPEEQLSFYEALALYTKSGAFAAMEESVLGEISPGFFGDFVVLRTDVTQNHAALVGRDLVESVWVNGKKAYQYDPASAPTINSQHDLSGSLLPGKNGPMRQDGDIVNVTAQPGSDYGSKVVEVIGRVMDSETIQEFKTTLFGDSFDLDVYDQVVQLSQSKYKHLFDVGRFDDGGRPDGVQEAVDEWAWGFGRLDVVDLALHEVHVVVRRVDALVQLEVSVVRVRDVVHDSSDLFAAEDTHTARKLIWDQCLSCCFAVYVLRSTSLASG
ncbi:unnamed protein product [Phytophthora fragariaefolia]|uniref:Unnamed protein product n=1 Tax=Phytophthora fragariaefolia TaxID=1490495 RepID=A0A9W7DAM3_9STRA|nr:unnamed protein product [Phytophthora fragariaefolia]